MKKHIAIFIPFIELSIARIIVEDIYIKNKHFHEYIDKVRYSSEFVIIETKMDYKPFGVYSLWMIYKNETSVMGMDYDKVYVAKEMKLNERFKINLLAAIKEDSIHLLNELDISKYERNIL